MFDKRSEKYAEQFGILDKMQSLEDDMMHIPGIVHVEFDIRHFNNGIKHVILIPKYDIDVTLPADEYFAARIKQLGAINAVCESHDLYYSGDYIQDYGAHWYIVRTCGKSW